MQTPGRKGLAVTDRRGHLRLWLTVAAGLAIDLASKYIGWSFLGGPPAPVGNGHEVEVIPGWLKLVASCNPGIVFGISFADGFGETGGRVLTVLLTLVTLGLIFYVFAISLASQRWMHIWCGLVMAGALGNLYDRLFFGFVRDLIQITAHFSFGSVTLAWPYVFNIADVYLVAGVIAVAAAFLFAKRPAAPKEQDEISGNRS
jgi:lipoprotein signal peptidase